MVKLFICLLIFSFFGSCASKKTTIQKTETFVHDTTYIHVDREIIKSVTDTLRIEEPCIEINDKPILKDFKRVLITPHGKVTLTNNKGNIEAQIMLDSLQNINIKKLTKSVKNTNIEKNVTEIKTGIFTCWRWLVALLGSLLLNIFFILRWFRIL